jgi:FKBP-type peptidyl-prolyl cis-trans isomerase FklB
MKQIIGLSAVIILAIGISSCNNTKNVTKEDLKTQTEKLSYSIGLDLGKNFKQQAIEVNPDILIKGLNDGINASTPLLTDTEIKETMKALQEDMMKKHAEKGKAEGEKNKKAGEEFLAAKKKEKGVVALPSGLMYKVIKEGKGKTPKLTDQVTTNYRGTLIDGKEFDSSYKRNQPATFPVNGVIKGWTEALQLMKEGSKWELYIPSELAYGEQGSPPNIGPGSTLIFEIELLKVN